MDATPDYARSCYDHLAGECGVALFDALVRRGWLLPGTDDDRPRLTEVGARALVAMGVVLEQPEGSRRPFCRECMDSSERRLHLGGVLGANLLQFMLDNEWLRRVPGSRALAFTESGNELFAMLCEGGA